MSERERDKPVERDRPEKRPDPLKRDPEPKPDRGNPWAKTSSGDKENVTTDE